MGNYFKIEPEFASWAEKKASRKNGKTKESELELGFYYSSENNPVWLDITKLKSILNQLEIES